jgi:hypothetical protein
LLKNFVTIQVVRFEAEISYSFDCKSKISQKQANKEHFISEMQSPE